MIFDKKPTDWRQLEELVMQAFNEMDCIVTRNKVISKIRSNSQIDVFVEDPIISPPATYICECKYWAKAVPKRVVQQFRTIISDSGANLGIIISRKGFQRGSHEEAQSTNIRLYSWEEFQKAFEERWTKTMAERLKKLSWECAEVASETYHIDSSPEGYSLTCNLDAELLREATLLVKVTSWEETVVQKSQMVRICETGPELRALPSDRWIELSTKRQFYDYAICLADSYRMKLQECLTILRAHPRLEK